MKMKTTLTALLVLCIATDASANIVNIDLGVAQNFNVFALSDFNATASDVLGAVAVGGNMSVSNYAVNSSNSAGYAGYSLVVNNNLSFTNGGVGSGNVYVGGAATTSNLGLTGSIMNGAPPFSFASTANSLYQLSATLAGLSANGLSNFDPWGGVIFTGDGTSNTQIFNVTGSQLLSANNIVYSNVQAGQTLIFNVSGSAAGFQAAGMPAFQGYNVLFNFSQATQIALNNVGVFGSVLAPYATITGANSLIDGNVVVNNWLAGTQVNNVGLFHSTTINVVPVPGTLALIFPPLGLLAWRRRPAKRLLHAPQPAMS